MKTYRIIKTGEPPPLTSAVEGTPWEHAAAAQVDNFPWYESGGKQGTSVRALYDERALYVQFLCEDRHLYSRATELNGPVWLDSCVELFAQPAGSGEYFNFEANCCGVFLVQRGAGRPGRVAIAPEIAKDIRVVASETGPTRDERPGDRAWWLAACLPFAALGELLNRPVRPAPSEAWRGNFYRCGGKTDPQYACWNPIELPRPDFHCPDWFGTFSFA